MFIKKLYVLLISLVIMASLCFALSPGDKAMREEIGPKDIRDIIKVGVSFDEVKSYLDARGVKYFSKKKEDIRPVVDGDFTVQLVFTIGKDVSGIGLSSVEKYTLVTVRFDENFAVTDLKMEAVYKGL